MSILSRALGWLRRRSPISSPGPSPDRKPRSPMTLPDGYREANLDMSEVQSPAMFDTEEYALLCDLCGETYPTYWGWFNHLEPEHGFLKVKNAWPDVTILIDEEVVIGETQPVSQPGDGEAGNA